MSGTLYALWYEDLLTCSEGATLKWDNLPYLLLLLAFSRNRGNAALRPRRGARLHVALLLDDDEPIRYVVLHNPGGKPY